jgi:hypothetical protein
MGLIHHHPAPEVALDMVLSVVNVMVLETGETLTYTNMKVRRAILNAFYQHNLRDYNTWNYDKLDARWANQVRVSKTGRTGSLRVGGVTYSALT